MPFKGIAHLEAADQTLKAFLPRDASTQDRRVCVTDSPLASTH
jgi:hypothetical protein